MNACPQVDVLRCLRDHNASPTFGHDHPGGVTEQLGGSRGNGGYCRDAVCGMGSMGGMDGMSTMPSGDILEAATKGLWELLPCPAPILAIHGAVLHTGKVLLFAGSGNDELFTTGLRSAVWDYENGEFISPFTPVDFFCAGQAFLPDGRLLVAGGTKEYDKDGRPFIGLETSYLFDPLSESWIRLASMAEGRWYPTLVTLGRRQNLHCLRRAQPGRSLFERDGMGSNARSGRLACFSRTCFSCAMAGYSTMAETCFPIRQPCSQDCWIYPPAQ